MDTKFIYETNQFVGKFLLEERINSLEDAITDIKNNPDRYVGFIKITDKIEQELIKDLKNVSSKYIYRALRVNSEEEIDKKRLGIFWTFDKYKAKAYWGEGDLFVLLKAKARNNDVDWLGTVEQHLNPQYSGEDEVRLKKDAHPHLVSIDITPIK